MMLPFFAYPVIEQFNWLSLVVFLAMIVLYPLYGKAKERYSDYKYRKKQHRIMKEVQELKKRMENAFGK